MWKPQKVEKNTTMFKYVNYKDPAIVIKTEKIDMTKCAAWIQKKKQNDNDVGLRWQELRNYSWIETNWNRGFRHTTKRATHGDSKMKGISPLFQQVVQWALAQWTSFLQDNHLLVQGINGFLIEVIASCDTHFPKVKYTKFLLYCTEELPSLSRQIR